MKIISLIPVRIHIAWVIRLRRIVLLAIIVIALSYIAYNAREIASILIPGLELPGNIVSILRFSAVALGIIWITHSIASAVRSRVPAALGAKAYQISSLVRISGYIIAIIVAAGVAGVDLTGLLAGGVAAGLVLGLALQPVLSNFFAGILLMATRMIEVGSVARIVTGSIPYTPTILPAYKFFSTDHVEVGYKGTIVDMNFFYTRMITDSGREIKIPNSLLLNSAIIDYSPEFSNKEIINVRVEMPLASIDLDSLEDMVRDTLRDFEIAGGPYINEQSDKDHVIILVKISVPENEDWRRVKSEALKRLLKLRKSLIAAQAATQR